MVNTPLISVCIANFNGINLIDACLQSVLQQEGGLPIDVIVHDDASTDASVAHIRANYPSVRVIESEKNVGFCIANNRMADIARGKYLLLLNNDATLFSDALITLHNASRDTAQPAILGLPQFDDESGKLLDQGMLLDPFLNPIPYYGSTSKSTGFVSGACLWIPKILWSKIGGFPDWFGSVAEDLYLCCRARLAGYEVVVLRHSGFRHSVGRTLGGSKNNQGTLTTTMRRRGLSERNKTFVIAICFPMPLLLILLPTHIALLLMEGIALSIVHRNFAIFFQIYVNTPASLWKLRVPVLATRAVTQAQREIQWLTFFRAFCWYPQKLSMLFRHGFPTIRE